MIALPEHYRTTVTRAAKPGVARLVSPHKARDTIHWSTRTYQAGTWIVCCLLCKDRTQFERQDVALTYASSGHRHWPAHQRLVGRYALELEIPDARGYDSPSSRQNPNNTGCGCGWEGSGEALWLAARGQQDKVEQRLKEQRAFDARVQAAHDEMARRRPPVAPPRLNWTTGPAQGPAKVTWSDGRYSTGTFYDLYADQHLVARIIALSEGGWLFNGRYMPDDQSLIRAAS